MDKAVSEDGYRTSSFSGDNGDCVAFKDLGNGYVSIKDTKDPTAPTHTYSYSEWRAFTRGVQNMEFEV
ncbi:DUF397 domain-containing protein [Nonomuraea sp. NPDC050643]|uniref:DUF397 domain-containing protein n=1 Tax=Nonomuraea sp. NPDC050643 TaxID=3155660 RepID=UPI0034095D87